MNEPTQITDATKRYAAGVPKTRADGLLGR